MRKTQQKNQKQQATTRGEARERLITAAQKLIIARGVDGVSIRAINAAAGVSPGILHYHFGSLDDLVLEIISRHIESQVQQRLELLNERLARGSFSMRDFAEVLALPLARLAIEGGEDGVAHVRFIARLYGDRSPLLDQALKRWMGDFNEKMFHTLQELKPDVPSDELALRLGLASNVLLRGLEELQGSPRDWQYRRGLSSDTPPWDRVNLIVDFMTAGLSGSGDKSHRL